MKENAITKINLFIVLITLSTSLANSQIISGIITDENAKPLRATILIKEVSKPNLIREFHIVRNGNFSFELKNTYPEAIIIEIVSTGFITKTKKVIFIKEINIYNFEFVLVKDTTTKLDQVLIVAKKPPVKKAKDTVSYNLRSFLDGSEEKVQDILKKLPGIEVNNETGLIKYNGKLIETVTLEGDNLFGYNYATGTKNINADIISSVEAIENYSENVLLKGIEKGDKVALNLKLKKNKTDFSGNFDLGLGVFDSIQNVASNSSINVLGINKSYKSFGTFSHNNVGDNASPFNYYSSDLNLERLKELDLFTEKIIPEFQIISFLENNKSNINNQLFTSYNSMFSLNKKLKLKVNLYYLKDKLRSNQLIQNEYKINENEFITFDKKNASKAPKQYRSDVELKYFSSKSTLLKYNLSLRKESIETNIDISSNQNNDYFSFLTSRNEFLKQKLEFTKRLSFNLAFQLYFIQSENTIIQDFNLIPKTSNNVIEDNIQKVDLSKNNIEIKSKILGSKNENKWVFDIGAFKQKEPFQSNLYDATNPDQTLNENTTNNLEYNKKAIYNFASYQHKMGDFRIAPNYTLSLIHQSLGNQITQSEDGSKVLVFEPSINIFYKVNSISSFTLDLGLNQNTNTIRNLFNNPVLINNRTKIQNTPNLSFQKNQFYSVSYNKHDLFNQLQLVLGAKYQKQKGNFFSNTTVNSNSNLINYFYLSDKTENLDFNLIFSKLISPINTNIKFSSFFSLSNYNNIVNNSILRNNKSEQFFSEFFIKTAFKSKINFENEISYQSNKVTSETIFKNESLINKFKIIYTPTDDLFGTLALDYFIPKFGLQSKNYKFLEVKISYKPVDEKWKISLIGSNLLGEDNFIQIQNTDISNNLFRSNLLNRYLLFSYSYIF
ncbi:hypothetical protein [Jejuia pallidilutea]|uniref:hypothetical protein n=1 Tax=Jejuia pallidilutea TaxID=504487 RepID=UPI000CFD90C8|nr:hypothetical protein [Jejuia pallidilutea]